eukprot:GHVL01034104.1.p1 GENE.GHVL01034104.1~~GHVL01034104.1.p1  ORF type:complete len:483 (+),score=109.46 GHVL01034104.1:59-1450(+)
MWLTRISSIRPSKIFLSNRVLAGCFTHFHTSSISWGKVTFKLADIGEGIAEVEVLKILKKEGEMIEEMDDCCEVQSDKAAVTISSRYAGKILKVYNNEGDIVKIGGPLFDIMTEDDGEEEQTELPVEEIKKKSVVNESSKMKGESVVTSPKFRRLAKEMGIDIEEVQGTGKGGRITEEDLNNHKNSKSKSTTSTPSAPSSSAPSSSAPSSSAPSAPAAPVMSVPERPQQENKDVPLRGFGRAMAKSMTESLKVPHMNIGEEADVTKLVTLRLSLKEKVTKQFGMNLTLTPLIIKAFSLALIQYPIINSKIDSSLEKYTQFGSHNISLAIDTPAGLVVPHIKNVQSLNLIEIQAELLRLQNLSSTNKLTSKELIGGTVCISNVGVVAGTYVKPLLFDGQACIAGIGRTQILPRFDQKGNVIPRSIMQFACSVDHRHIDGATAARFCKAFRDNLENPDSMLLYMV